MIMLFDYRANKFEHPSYITDGTVAMCCCLMLFVIPSSLPTCCYISGIGSDRGQVDDRCQHPSDQHTEVCSGEEEVKLECEPSAEDTSDSDAVCESPSRAANQSSDDNYILDWSDVQRINWNIIFLLGGAFALSAAFQESGNTRLR